MADTKITALAAIGANPIIPATFPIPMVDLTDTSMAASGTTKKVTVNQILGAGGTATLASATITGDLTVDTSTLKVDSSNNRVGIVKTTPAYPLDVGGRISYSGAIGEGADTTVSSIGSSLLFGNAAGWADCQFFAGGNSQHRIQSGGVFTWYDGAGGTRMTLNSTGLGVGTTNYICKIQAAGLIGAADPTFGSAGTFIGAILNNDNTAPGLDLRRWTGSAANHGTTYISTDATGATFFYNGQQASNTKATSLKMTLDASGNLLVGTTSSASNAGIGLKAAYSATAPYYSTVGSSNASNAYSYLLYSTTDAAFKFYVSYSGTVSATNGTISAISDSRLKENVQDIDVGLGAILALKPRKFDWKAGKGKDIKGDRGFIAQEFEQVFPNLVDEWKDAAPEGEAPYKSVRQDLIPVLVKAIQELAAEVNALKNA